MRIAIPRHGTFNMTRVIVHAEEGVLLTTTCDDSHRFADIALPEGVAEDDVAVTACFLTASGQPAPGVGEVLLKEPVVKPKPTPEPKAKKAKAEPKPEPMPEDQPLLEPQPESKNE